MLKLAVHVVITGLQRVKSPFKNPSQLMLYKEIIAVCFQIRTKQVNILCGQNVDLLNIKTCGTHSNHWVLNG